MDITVSAHRQLRAISVDARACARWAPVRGRGGRNSVRCVKPGECGFTLVEVLVTIIVMAVGILGVAGLQLAGMRSNHSAYLRSQATIAASDLIDRMRADPAAFAGKRFDSATASDNPMFEDWRRQLPLIGLRASASGPQGALDCSAGNACGTGHCSVIVRWDDSRADYAPSGQRDRGTDALAFAVCTRLAQ